MGDEEVFVISVFIATLVTFICAPFLLFRDEEGEE